MPPAGIDRPPLVVRRGIGGGSPRTTDDQRKDTMDDSDRAPAAAGTGRYERWKSPARPRTLTATQMTAIRAVMSGVMESDRSDGVAPQARMRCDGCQRVRPSVGFIEYSRHSLCNACATEYEVARARGLALSAGQFVREKVFGEAEAYALSPSEA